MKHPLARTVGPQPVATVPAPILPAPPEESLEVARRSMQAHAPVCATGVCIPRKPICVRGDCKNCWCGRRPPSRT